MSLPATEIAILPLIAGAAIEQPDTSSGRIWHDTLDTIAQQDGYQRLFWGRRIEKQSDAVLLIDWDSIESHEKFRKSPAYGPFSRRIDSIVDTPVSPYHAYLKPHATTAATKLAAPVTEFVTFYFPSSISSDDKKDFDEAMASFLDAPQQHADGFRGASTGWIVEEVEHASVGKGRGYVAALGWNSVEAHMAFRETDEFKKAIAPIREKAKGSVMYHIKFQEKSGI